MEAIERAWSVRYAEAASNGAPVIGVVGADLPPALPAALGALPVELSGFVGSASDEARELLGAATDAAALGILTQVLDGRFDFLTGLVVCRDSSASLNLFYVLRGLRDAGRLPFPVHLCQILRLRRPSTVAFNEIQLRTTVDEMSRWLDAAFSVDAYRGAWQRYADLDAAMRALRQRRRDGGGLAGSTFLQAVGVATAYPPEAARALLHDVPETRTNGPRLFYTGSAQRQPDLYRAVEELGTIVGEDHDGGDLRYGGPPPPEPTDDVFPALAAWLVDRPPAAPTASLAERREWTAREFTTTRADVLLAVVREHDDGPAWDLPGQRAKVGGRVAACVRQPATNFDDVIAAVKEVLA